MLLTLILFLIVQDVSEWLSKIYLPAFRVASRSFDFLGMVNDSEDRKTILFNREVASCWIDVTFFLQKDLYRFFGHSNFYGASTMYGVYDFGPIEIDSPIPYL